MTTSKYGMLDDSADADLDRFIAAEGPHPFQDTIGIVAARVASRVFAEGHSDRVLTDGVRLKIVEALSAPQPPPKAKQPAPKSKGAGKARK